MGVTSLIDHFNLPVRDLKRSQEFYTSILGTLGISKVAEDGPAIGYGRGVWQFGIEQFGAIGPRLHLAFKATSESQVQAFYLAALETGAVSNGEPGLRPEYGASYFAAFVIDPDGHNIEVVYRGDT